MGAISLYNANGEVNFQPSAFSRWLFQDIVNDKRIKAILFWKARLKNPGLEVLKGKISRYFTRLAFEECLFFSKNENEYYIDYKGRNKEEIIKIRREFGYID
ncbi:hypothetical protein LCGC14_2752260 [marine sediment metagenome]|uniref:Uncharacterized protein n=1 Tax=marine sediment metagenome TaxID=412755 RepID=A0A0F8ZNG2_9ZZZZ